MKSRKLILSKEQEDKSGNASVFWQYVLAYIKFTLRLIIGKCLYPTVNLIQRLTMYQTNTHSCSSILLWPLITAKYGSIWAQTYKTSR